MCQPVTVRLVFKIKTNYYFRCFIWHADIGQNIVNYYYKNRIQWHKILNQIWKRIIFKIKVFQNEEETISTANIFEKCIVSFWIGLKTNMKRCRCFLGNNLLQGISETGESPPLAQSHGRWVRHHQEGKAKENQNWYYCRRQRKGDTRQPLSLPSIT